MTGGGVERDGGAGGGVGDGAGGGGHGETAGAVEGGFVVVGLVDEGAACVVDGAVRVARAGVELGAVLHVGAAWVGDFGEFVGVGARGVDAEVVVVGAGGDGVAAVFDCGPVAVVFFDGGGFGWGEGCGGVAHGGGLFDGGFPFSVSFFDLGFSFILGDGGVVVGVEEGIISGRIGCRAPEGRVASLGVAGCRSLTTCSHTSAVLRGGAGEGEDRKGKK